MTTSEQTEKPWNWHEVLDRLIAGEEGSLCREAKNRACSWVTCAAGSLCDTIRRDEFGVPIDRFLYHEGVHFMLYCSAEEWEMAEISLAAIEARSTKLLRKMGLLTEKESK